MSDEFTSILSLEEMPGERQQEPRLDIRVNIRLEALEELCRLVNENERVTEHIVEGARRCAYRVEKT